MKDKPRIGFTCGAFDLLHAGHILMLQDARNQCDYLIVGLHVDPSIERPDKHKPIQAIEERMVILSACRYVDIVIPYHTEQDLINLLMIIKPDIRIIGSDWQPDKITGGELGIPIYWHKRNHNWSTSELRNRICKAQTC